MTFYRCFEEMTEWADEMAFHIFRNTYLNPALEAGWIEPTIPDKPTSRNEKYRLTELRATEFGRGKTMLIPRPEWR